MSETVHNVTDLPVKHNSLRKFAKRTTLVAIAATVVVTAIYLKTKSNEETVDTTVTA